LKNFTSNFADRQTYSFR